MLFFGCFNHDDLDKNDIFIYSVSKRILIESAIKCPEDSIYHAIAVSDEESDEKTEFGFIRKHWGLSQIPNIISLHIIH